jgi:limonene-1,2-epoxide hydrolase
MTHMAPTDPDAVVTALMDATLRHDPDEIAAFFTEDATCQLMPGSTVEGKDAIRALFAQFAGMTTDLRIDLHRQLSSGNVVMTERTDYFTLGDNAMALGICGVFEIEDGLVKAWRDYYLDPLPVPPSS